MKFKSLFKPKLIPWEYKIGFSKKNPEAFCVVFECEVDDASLEWGLMKIAGRTDHLGDGEIYEMPLDKVKDVEFALIRSIPLKKVTKHMEIVSKEITLYRIARINNQYQLKIVVEGVRVP